MEELNNTTEIVSLTKIERLTKKIKTIEDDIKAKRLSLKTTKKELDAEKAKEIFKLMDETGIDIDAAKKILEKAHQNGALDE